MELLCPAGSWEAMTNAVANGADAVYLGYTAFGARATASNFDEETLRRAIAYCHARHVRVYVTVNTLVKESEMADAYQVGALLTDARADAALVQDIGVARMFARCFPSLPLHASTQMAIHNPQGVEFVRSLGMTRAVLARECSLDTIRACCETGLEIEIFVHGAQCVSVSGECLFSSMVGGRSGNRGRCAQPCRLEYTFDGKKAAWLSPRDVKLRDDLPALLQAGVASLKIEGRLKRPEYVAVVTAAYRRALDDLYKGTFRKADEKENLSLLQIFNRGGFSRGYPMGTQDAATVDITRVNHAGVMIGTVAAISGNLATLSLTRPLHNGDGLQLRGKSDRDVTYSGPDAPAGGTALLRLRPGLAAQRGDLVARLTDEAQLQSALNVTEKKVPADLSLTLTPGSPAELHATDGQSKVTVTGEIVQAAQKAPITQETARKAMEKTGGTLFALQGFTLSGEHAFMTMAALNDLRRRAYASLEDSRAEHFALPRKEILPCAPEAFTPRKAPETLVESAFLSVGQEAAKLGAAFVYAPQDFTALCLNGLPENTWLKLPAQMTGKTLEAIRQKVLESKDKLAGVVIDNIGMLDVFSFLPVGCGTGVPVTNASTIAQLTQKGAAFYTLSPELTKQELEALPLSDTPAVLTVYGRTRLMLLNHCPARTALGLAKGRADCRMCDKRQPESLLGKCLTDRMGCDFPMRNIRLPEGCLIELYNCLPTDLTEKAARLPVGFSIVFTVEGEGAQLALTRQYLTTNFLTLTEKTTAGHFLRGVL